MVANCCEFHPDGISQQKHSIGQAGQARTKTDTLARAAEAGLESPAFAGGYGGAGGRRREEINGF